MKEIFMNKKLMAGVAFAVVALVLILVGILAFREPVVPVCAAILIEAMLALVLHKVELWMHGITVGVQVIIGALIGRLPLFILCVILYVAATAVQYWMDTNEQA